MKKLLLGVTLSLLLFSQASASDIDGATITRLMIDRSHGAMVFIELDIAQSTPEACHINGAWEYVLDISDDLGKTMYSSLLTLKASGGLDRLIGTGDCTQYYAIEDLRRVEMK